MISLEIREASKNPYKMENTVIIEKETSDL